MDLNDLLNVFVSLNVEQTQQMMITLRVIRNDRNREIHRQESRPAKETIVFIQQYINEFNHAQQKEQSITSNGDKKWQPPPNGCVKIKFEGAWSME